MNALGENQRRWRKIPELYQGKKTFGKYPNAKKRKRRRKDIYVCHTCHLYDVTEGKKNRKKSESPYNTFRFLY